MFETNLTFYESQNEKQHLNEATNKAIFNKTSLLTLQVWDFFDSTTKRLS